MLHFVLILIVLYMLFDVNYFIRTAFTLLSCAFQRDHSLNDVTTIYGLCTLQDCDLWFKNIRLARLVRELDFARYHFYACTKILQRSRVLKIKSLQGCTLTSCIEPVPLFSFYKMNTRLIYWDERSLFFEHEVVTLFDHKLRYVMISRQHAIGEQGEKAHALLFGLTSLETKPVCPDYIKSWLTAMDISSRKIRKN